MARNVSLIKLLDDLRAEMRASLNPSHNSQVRDVQVRTIQRTQEWLWSDFDWPHLRVYRTMPLSAGQRFYSPPADITIERIVQIDVRYGGDWCPVRVGIGPEHYSEWDSELDERSWPVERYQLVENDEFEVWPISAIDGNDTDLEGYLRITGIRNLRPLVQDGDRCDLDDRLIVLFAAAEMWQGKDEKVARFKLEQANKLYGRIRRALMPRRDFRLFGDDRKEGRQLRGPPRVHYRVI